LRPSRKSDEEERMNKFLNYFLVIAVTVVLTLAFSAAVTGPRAAAAPVPAASAPAAPAAAPMPPHPHIDEALEAMHNAKHHLETAEHDFHGHRVEAIKHLDAAIHEAEICASEP
jgi:hypothetical protein